MGRGNPFSCLPREGWASERARSAFLEEGKGPAFREDVKKRAVQYLSHVAKVGEEKNNYYY